MGFLAPEKALQFGPIPTLFFEVFDELPLNSQKTGLVLMTQCIADIG